MLTLACKCDGRSKKDQYSKVHVTPHLHLNRCATDYCYASLLPVQRYKGLDVPTSSASDNISSSSWKFCQHGCLLWALASWFNSEDLLDTDASQQSGTQQRSHRSHLADVNVEKAYLSDWVPMQPFPTGQDIQACAVTRYKRCSVADASQVLHDQTRQTLCYEQQYKQRIWWC